MSNTSEKFQKSDVIESLLEQAVPRLTPPAQDEERVRQAVRKEWQAITRKQLVRRRTMQFALAASLLLAVAVVFNISRVTDVVPIEVAAVDKSFGDVYMLGEQSRLDPIGDLENISAGQIIETGADAAIGLAWGRGGSLRVDSRTRVEFVSADAIHLVRGRVYFDSLSDNVVFTVDTDHGSITHTGTQYMVAADLKSLAVSVRDGRVDIDGDYYDESIGAGYQVRITGREQPVIVNIATHGKSWQWVESIAPAADLKGKTIDEFLVWVSHETGLELIYEGQAKAIAQNEKFVGTVDRPPREELRLRMLTTNLGYRIDAGTITVFEGKP